MNSFVQISALLLVCYLCVLVHGGPAPLTEGTGGSSSLVDTVSADAAKDDLDAAGFWGWGLRGGWGGLGWGSPYGGYYGGYHRRYPYWG